MANYTSNTSDKSKGTAIKFLLAGGIGLHYFYVGRIKGGLLHLIFGVLFWGLLIDGIIEGQVAMIASGIGLLVLVNLVDLARLILGTFKDNIGAYLRA